MGIGMRELLVILVVALLVFGTKKLKTIGSDLGGAVRGFKKAMEEGESEGTAKPDAESPAPVTVRTIADAPSPSAPSAASATSPPTTSSPPTGSASAIDRASASGSGLRKDPLS